MRDIGKPSAQTNKIYFGTKWTHMDATDVSQGRVCAKFRSGSNGTGPGAQNPDFVFLLKCDFSENPCNKNLGVLLELRKKKIQH